MQHNEVQKFVLRACDGPVCWLKRASAQHSIVSEWTKKMPADDWTVERTSCLGLCDRAPAVLVDDEQAGPALPRQAKKICEGWRGVPTDYSKPRTVRAARTSGTPVRHLPRTAGEIGRASC